MSKCPNCGGELNFNVKDKVVKCDYCKSEFDPKELRTKLKYSKEVESFEGKSYNCTQCGAQLLTFDETAVTFCSYCGSQSVIESNMVKINNPDLIIPFKKTKEECIQAYKSYLNKALFVPNYMKSDFTIEKIRGIYMPYAIYKASLHGTSQNHGSKYSHRSGDYVYYDEYTISARVDAEYNGISYDLLSKYYDNYSMSIPFNYKEAEPFNKNYLMGFYADTKDVEDYIYDSEAERIATNDTTRFMKKRREYRKYGCKDPKAKLDVKDDDRKSAMFPVYFLGVKDKDNKMHYAVINGQTGKVAADLPIDFKKFIFGTLILSLVLFAILHFANIILIPKTVLFLSMLAAIVSMVVSISQLKKAFDKEYHLNDEGYLSGNGKNLEFIPFSKKETKSSNLKVILIILACFFAFPFVTMAVLSLFDSSIAIFVIFGLFFIGMPILVSKLNNNNKTKKTTEVYKDGKKVKKYKIANLKFQIISLIIGALVFLSGTIKDEIIYGSAILVFILIILSFSDLIKEHNILTSSKPPQLEKRGGDENGK